MKRVTSILLAAMTIATASLPATAVMKKPVIAIGQFESRVQGLDPEALRAMLETAFSKTRKFELIERSRLNDLLKEQGLSVSGVTEGAGKVGGISGVDYLLYGTITEASLQEKNLLLLKNCDATLGVDARIVDVATGSIRKSEHVAVTHTVGSSPTNVNACSGIGSNSFGDLDREAADLLAERISQALFPVKIINVSNGQVYLNYGSPALQSGDYLKLVRKGESVVDPDTGEVLGAEETEVGLIQVSEIRGKFSVADVLDANEPVANGMVAIKLNHKEGKKLAKDAQKKHRRR